MSIKGNLNVQLSQTGSVDIVLTGSYLSPPFSIRSAQNLSMQLVVSSSTGGVGLNATKVPVFSASLEFSNDRNLIGGTAAQNGYGNNFVPDTGINGLWTVFSGTFGNAASYPAVVNVQRPQPLYASFARVRLTNVLVNPQTNTTSSVRVNIVGTDQQ